MRKLHLIISITFFFCINIFAQEQDERIFKSGDKKLVIDFIQSIQANNTNYTSGELMILAARHLMGIPYVANTLEVKPENKLEIIEDKEELIVNLRSLDCVTLVENCLALIRTTQSETPDTDYFFQQLKNIRYRNGIIDGYSSRLHYTTDWIYDSVKKGILKDITQEIGGIKLPLRIHFMSSHPESYPILKTNDREMARIKEIEQKINQRSYYYIPKNKIKEKQASITNGDIICFTTSIAGLDVSHLGIAYWNNGKLTFIHASSKHKKVLINPESLIDYCNGIKRNTGIIILRP